MHTAPAAEPPAVATETYTETYTAQHAATHHVETDDGLRKSWLGLALALAAQILVVLDISVVNTALPSIGHDLHLDGPDMQWVVTAYLMMSGGGLLFGGRVADLLSRKSVFLTGLAVFIAASIVSGFAGGAIELITARATQGLSAALMTPRVSLRHGRGPGRVRAGTSHPGSGPVAVRAGPASAQLRRGSAARTTLCPGAEPVDGRARRLHFVAGRPLESARTRRARRQ
ncbi:MAG: MFS transporter [Terracoccus sp.]